jgi:hypothetical protein
MENINFLLGGGGRPLGRWECNMKMGLKEIHCEDVDRTGSGSCPVVGFSISCCNNKEVANYSRSLIICIRARLLQEETFPVTVGAQCGKQ